MDKFNDSNPNIVRRSTSEMMKGSLASAAHIADVMSTPRGAGLRKVPVCMELLPGVVDMVLRLSPDWPDDTKVESVDFDWRSNRLVFKVRSKDYAPEADEYGEIPVVSPVLHSEDVEAAKRFADTLRIKRREANAGKT